jgi:hypothetical protein
MKYLVLAIPLFAIALLVYLIGRDSIRSKRSSRPTDFIRQRGGARVVGWNYTWPFASLTISQRQLVLHAGSKRYVLPRERITGLTLGRGLFSPGLELHHSDPALPKPLIFWTFSANELERALESYGYQIESGPHFANPRPF